MCRYTETELHFRKLHKSWGGGLWFRFLIFGITTIMVIDILDDIDIAKTIRVHLANPGERTSLVEIADELGLNSKDFE